ncbi:hypothetical protein LTS10_011192 [Elasticomyces elasticus]|nr:hypothetical protein LTS10_011192 [Elasticomyces elasticus]
MPKAKRTSEETVEYARHTALKRKKATLAAGNAWPSSAVKKERVEEEEDEDVSAEDEEDAEEVKAATPKISSGNSKRLPSAAPCDIILTTEKPAERKCKAEVVDILLQAYVR